MSPQQYFMRIIANIAAHKWSFIGTFFFVFTITYAVLFVLDWLPEPPASEASRATAVAMASNLTDEVSDEESTTATQDEPAAYETDAVSLAPLPTSITFDTLDKTIDVINPTSRTIADLDAALLSGAVRHPDSATLVDDGNVFILGHSSYLPNVLNRNYQAFNGIQNLGWGDTIRLTSDDAEYVYRVEKVYQAKASALTVPVAGTGKILTLATCNSFGSTDDRYIVEAKLIETNRLAPGS